MHMQFIVRTALITSVALLVGCGTPDPGARISTGASTNIAAQPTPNTSVMGPSIGAASDTANQPQGGETVSYDIVRSFKEAVERATIVVVGEVTGTGNIFNTHRDAYDTSKPATDSFGIGQEYAFHVERYLKGSDAPSIIVVQVEGAIFAPVDQVTPALIAQTKATSSDVSLKAGQQYLLFLKGPFDYSGKHYYSAIGEPWKFQLDADGRATMETPGTVQLSLPEDFLAKLDAPLVPQITQAIQAEQAAKP